MLSYAVVLKFDRLLCPQLVYLYMSLFLRLPSCQTLFIRLPSRQTLFLHLPSCQTLFLRLPSRQTSRRCNYVLNLSIHQFVSSFICYQTCQHDVLKTNEPITMPNGTNGPRGKGMKRSTLGVRRSKVKVTQGQKYQNSENSVFSTPILKKITRG